MEAIEFNLSHIKSELKNRCNTSNVEKYINNRLNKSLDLYNKELTINITSLKTYKDTTILKRI